MSERRNGFWSCAVCSRASLSASLLGRRPKIESVPSRPKNELEEDRIDPDEGIIGCAASDAALWTPDTDAISASACAAKRLDAICSEERERASHKTSAK